MGALAPQGSEEVLDPLDRWEDQPEHRAALVPQGQPDHRARGGFQGPQVRGRVQPVQPVPLEKQVTTVSLDPLD